MTTTPIHSSLLGRASQAMLPVAAPVGSVHAAHHAHAAAPAASVGETTVAFSTTMTSATFAVTNEWLGGCTGSGSGKGHGKYASKRIHPGRLEGMT